jgi:hypothetical protein
MPAPKPSPSTMLPSQNHLHTCQVAKLTSSINLRYQEPQISSHEAHISSIHSKFTTYTINSTWLASSVPSTNTLLPSSPFGNLGYFSLSNFFLPLTTQLSAMFPPLSNIPIKECKHPPLSPQPTTTTLSANPSSPLQIVRNGPSFLVIIMATSMVPLTGDSPIIISQSMHA